MDVIRPLVAVPPGYPPWRLAHGSSASRSPQSPRSGHHRRRQQRVRVVDRSPSPHSSVYSADTKWERREQRKVADSGWDTGGVADLIKHADEDEAEAMERAACLIQAHVRGRNARRKAAANKALLERLELDHAARKIQTMYRGRIARRTAGKRRMLLDMMQDMARKKAQKLVWHCFAVLAGPEAMKRMRRKQRKDLRSKQKSGTERQLAWRRSRVMQERQQRQADEKHRQEMRAFSRKRHVEEAKKVQLTIGRLVTKKSLMEKHKRNTTVTVWKMTEKERQQAKAERVRIAMMARKAKAEENRRNQAGLQAQNRWRTGAGQVVQAAVVAGISTRANTRAAASTKDAMQAEEEEEDELAAHVAARKAWLLASSPRPVGPSGWHDDAAAWRLQLRLQSMGGQRPASARGSGDTVRGSRGDADDLGSESAEGLTGQVKWRDSLTLVAPAWS
jgi:hypothetical protein